MKKTTKFLTQFCFLLILSFLCSCNNTGSQNDNTNEGENMEEGAAEPEEMMGAEKSIEPRVTGIAVKKAVVQVASVKRDGGTCSVQDGCVHLCIPNPPNSETTYDFSFDVENGSREDITLDSIRIKLVKADDGMPPTFTSCPRDFEATTIRSNDSESFTFEFCVAEIPWGGMEFRYILFLKESNGNTSRVVKTLNYCSDSEF